MKLKAILASVGLAAGSLFAVGGVQVLSQTAAHATPASEVWLDETASGNGFCSVSCAVYWDAHGQMYINNTSTGSYTVVNWTGAHWCVGKVGSLNPIYSAPISTSNYQVIANFGCGSNEYYNITCVGPGSPYEFTLTSLESGASSVGYQSSDSLFYAIGNSDVFFDESHTEC